MTHICIHYTNTTLNLYANTLYRLYIYIYIYMTHICIHYTYTTLNLYANTLYRLYDIIYIHIYVYTTHTQP